MGRAKREEEKKKLNVVGYIRVSLEEQARGGLSVEGQEQHLRRYCELNGHTLAEICRDEGKSGKKSIEKRDGARAAMEMVRTKKVDGIVVWKLDRLGRDANELTKIAKQCQKSGWALLSATENLDSSNFMGKFFIHLLAGLAEMESGRIGERVAMGMEQLVVRNRVRSPNTPFGFRMPDGKTRPRSRKRSDEDQKKIGAPDSRPMVEHPAEQKLLQEILKMKAKGLSPFKIANALNAKGVKNPRTKGPWWRNSIDSICKTVAKRDRILESA